jgi:plasmid maintenance system antidote protein VapI
VEHKIKLKEFGLFCEEEYKKHFKNKLDFAAAINVDERSIRRILKGEQNISFKILLDIAKVFNLTASALLERINC